MTSVSIIVPATNEPPTLGRCVAALRGADGGPDEIIVVDGPPHLNAAAARNAGAARASGDVLLFVDSDVELHGDAVRRVRERFDADPDLAALFGSYDDAPTEKGLVSAFRNLLHHHVHHQSPGAASTFWTGLGAVRRDAFEALGGFDEQVEFMEDVDLGMRLSADGSSIELDPAIQCTHLKRWTLTGMVATDFWGRGVPWTVLLLRHRGSAGALNLGWSHRLSALAAVVAPVALLGGRRRVALGCVLTLVALNRRFYVLLWRRRGPAAAAAGVALHAVHHAVGAAAVPVGIARFLGKRAPAPRSRSR